MTSDIDKLAEEFDVDLDLEEVQPELDTKDSSRVDMEAKEATVVKPFKPGNGFVKDETHNFVLEDGSQFSLRVEERPECPSCQHVLADAEEPNHLSGTCTVCGTDTCHRCRSECAACGTLLCPDCTTGHGLKDGTYCSDCLVDVDEDVEFEREMEKREQRHSEEMDELEYELKEKEKEKKLELQEAKQQREQIRQDWKVVIQALKTLQEDDTEEESKKGGDVFGGSGEFQGSGAFTEGKEFTDSNGSDTKPDWFEEADKEIDQKLGE